MQLICKLILLSLVSICLSNLISIPLEVKSSEENFQTESNFLNTRDFNLDNPGLLMIEAIIGTEETGKEPQKFNLVVDTGSYIICVGKKGTNILTPEFDPDSSSSFDKEFSIPIDNTTLINGQGSIVMDNISFPGDILGSSFPIEFGLLTELKTDKWRDIQKKVNISGIFGLGRNYASTHSSIINSNQNIIHLLKNKGYIQNEVFSIESSIINEKYVYTLHIGDYHSHFNDSSPFCSLRQKDQAGLFWTCRLSYIMNGTNFEENAQEVDLKVSFNSGINYSLGSISLLNSLLSILGDKCKKQTINESIDSIECTDNKTEIYFVFNGYSLKIPNLYRKNATSGTYYINFRFSDTIRNNQLGLDFFKDYHLLFDSKNGEILFYNSLGYINDFQNYTYDDDTFFKEHLVANIFGILIIITVISFILTLIIMKNKTNKDEDEINKTRKTEGVQLIEQSL